LGKNQQNCSGQKNPRYEDYLERNNNAILVTMPKKTTWQEKLHDSKDQPQVELLTGKMAQKWGNGTLGPVNMQGVSRQIDHHHQ